MQVRFGPTPASRSSEDGLNFLRNRDAFLPDQASHPYLCCQDFLISILSYIVGVVAVLENQPEMAGAVTAAKPPREIFDVSHPCKQSKRI